MILIGASIVCGLIGVLLALSLGIDGSKVSQNFIFAVWMIGFFSPGLYVLNKVYKEMINKK